MLRPGTMMVSRAGEQLARRQCGCCGEELNAHQAVSSGVCDRQRCQDWKIEQAGAELLQRRRRELRDRLFREAEAAVERIAGDLGIEADLALRVVLPAQAKPLAPQRPERLAAFREHLHQIVEEAFAEPAQDPEAPARAAIEAPEGALLSTACAICAGHCCDRGGMTGMLTAADIRRWRARAMDSGPEQAVEAFVFHLPAESVSDSCVYLGAEGCALPRRMRSDWCNRFQCRERAALAEASTEAEAAPVLMVAHDRDGDRPGGAGGWSPAGARVVPMLAEDEGESASSSN